MAYDLFNKQDEEQNQPVPGQPQALGAESPVISGNTPQSAGKPSQSGSFTNLNSYLDANKSLGFGQQVAGQVTGEVAKAGEAQQQAESGFKTAADQGAVQKDDSLIGRVNTDPQSITANQGDLSSWEKMRDANYSGPKNLVDTSYYQPAQQQTQRAYDIAQQTKDEGGRKAYLASLYGPQGSQRKADYTAGQQKLDNLLIQQDPESKTAFQNAWGQAQAQQNKFTDLNAALNQYAQQRQGETSATRAAARGALGINDAGNYLDFDTTRGNAGALQDTVENLDDVVNAKKASLAGIRSTLEGGQGTGNIAGLSPEFLSTYGLTPQQLQGFDVRPQETLGSSYEKYYAPYQYGGGSFFGVDPMDAQYANIANEADLNRGTLGDANTQARIQALTQLAGKENTLVSNPEAQGSMLNQPLYTTNAQKFAGDVNQRTGALKNELAAALQGHEGIVSTQAQEDEGNRIRAKYGLPPIYSHPVAPGRIWNL